MFDAPPPGQALKYGISLKTQGQNAYPISIIISDS